jgi:hypothetical protein
VNWLWLNIPLMAAFFIGVAGIPLWLVLRRPDFGPQAADQPGRVPAAVAARYAEARAGSAALGRPAAIRGPNSPDVRRQLLAGGTG